MQRLGCAGRAERHKRHVRAADEIAAVGHEELDGEVGALRALGQRAALVRADATAREGADRGRGERGQGGGSEQRGGQGRGDLHF